MNQQGFVLPSPLLIVTLIAIALGAMAAIFWSLYQGALDDYREFKISVEVQQENIRIANEHKLALSEARTAEADAGWKAALALLGKRGPIRVRPDICPGTVPTVPVAAARVDEAAPELRSDPVVSITVEQCEARVNAAVVDAAQVTWLQHWIKQQHEVK